ncbi:CPBP family intramembrane glutamic endopeptidase [Aurantimicrobium minutum]|uniref:CPBP family intramembrane glutamic endopeptidase n=1 Tax=Aurantimicrobium minutum TaxID=708131 RepID=UPI00248E0676|nr:CPBP family intramembrane glutamic endopeptidase [Aurantimicrobium minutum]
MTASAPSFTLPATQWTQARMFLSALLVVSSAPLFFVFHTSWGYLTVVAGLALAFSISWRFARDLLLIAIPLVGIEQISLKANLEWGNIALMGTVLVLAVAVPYSLSRWVFKDHAITFPGRPGQPWTRLEWIWLGLVLILGWLILPLYFIGSGSYLNWPAVAEPSEIARLFVGVGFVGIWDELFFICTIFALLRRHFPLWIANGLQAIVFVSFLWELGYRSWGPLLTIPFALIQAWIFEKSKSVYYVITVHLLFDVVVFLVLIYAYHPQWAPIFLFPAP